MSALKKKTTKKAPARPAAKSKSKGRAPVKGGKPVARPARRIIPAVPPLKAKSRGEKAAAKPMVVLPKLPAHLVAAIRALDEKKAVEIRVLEMGQISSVADFLVIATGTSEPHLRALRIALDQEGLAEIRQTQSGLALALACLGLLLWLWCFWIIVQQQRP
jgi:hypothetical protein